MVILKFHNNFVEGFIIDLKTFLGLAMPNQPYLDITSAGFWGDILGQKIPS